MTTITQATKIVNLSGELNLYNVLFAYEDVESKSIYIVTYNNNLNTSYEIYTIKNIVTKVPKTMFGVCYGYNKVNINKHMAMWIGASNETIVKNGVIAEDGDFFLGENGFKKRKLTTHEFNEVLNKEYQFEA